MHQESRPKKNDHLESENTYIFLSIKTKHQNTTSFKNQDKWTIIYSYNKELGQAGTRSKGSYSKSEVRTQDTSKESFQFFL